MHHEDGRADFVDVIEEAAVGIGLRTDRAPAVVRVTAALVVAAFGLVVVEVVFDKLWCVIGQGIYNTAGHCHRISQALLGHCLTGSMARFLFVLAVEIAITADACHIIHRRSNGSLDAGVGSGSIQGDASPAADADDANLLSIHIILLGKEIHSRHEVLGIDVG